MSDLFADVSKECFMNFFLLLMSQNELLSLSVPVNEKKKVVTYSGELEAILPCKSLQLQRNVSKHPKLCHRQNVEKQKARRCVVYN